MKKHILAFILFAAACQMGKAQATTLSGTVKNESGMPLPYAFLQDKHSGNAAYADSAGMFTMPVTPSSQVTVSCRGYLATPVDVAGHNTIDIILKKDPAYTAAANGAKSKDMENMDNAFKTYTATAQGPAYANNGTLTFSNIKETVGSRFLFAQWVHGYLIRTNGQIVQGQSLLLNYDKTTGDLYLTEDQISVLLADRNLIERFVLYTPQNKPYTFELVPGVSHNLFTQVISTGPKYSIYKLTTTKFIAANYKSDGMTSSGNNYDEYADEYAYYVQNAVTKSLQPLSLKKKALKEAFASEGDKITGFLAAHNGKIDDEYLAVLGDAMNR